MLGRPATRIELKMEEDLIEYEEFKLAMQQSKEQDKLKNIGSAFGIQGAGGMIGIPGGALGSLGYNEISSYADLYKEKGSNSR